MSTKINLFRGRCRSIFELSLPEFLRNAEHRELFLSGLRLAAGETESARPAALLQSSPPTRRK